MAELTDEKMDWTKAESKVAKLAKTWVQFSVGKLVGLMVG